MTRFDSAIIKAFFTADDIEQARALTVQSELAQPAAGVYRVTIDGFDVQIDGFTFPGCTSCGCKDFRDHRSCGHTCLGVALMMEKDPSIQEMIWPDTNAALNSELLESDSFYELKMLPLTYSPSCQGELTFAETVLDKAQQCRGTVDDEQIAKEVTRLFDDYFEQSEIWGPEANKSEVDRLIALLRNLGVSDKEIRALIAQYPEYSTLFPRRWWPLRWWIQHRWTQRWWLQSWWSLLRRAPYHQGGFKRK